MYVCIFGFKGASTCKVICARNEMMMDDYDGQIIFGDPVGLKLPDIHLTGEEKPQKNLTQETCPSRGLNPGLLHDKRACYHLFHSGGRKRCGGPGTHRSAILEKEKISHGSVLNISHDIFNMTKVFFPRLHPSSFCTGQSHIMLLWVIKFCLIPIFS